MPDIVSPRTPVPSQSDFSASEHRQKALDALTAAEEYRLGQGSSLLNATALVAIAQVHATLALSATKPD